jgi:cell division control protein 45
MYSLASELGREDNDLLWLAIIGVGSLDLYGRSTLGVGVSAKDDYYSNHHYNAVSNGHTSGAAAAAAGRGGWWGGERMERIRQLLRDEVRRLNPPALTDAHTNRHNINHHSQHSTAHVSGEGGGIVMITGGSGDSSAGGGGMADGGGGGGGDIIPTHARSPTDTAIRLSPEPRLLLIRHWSLYDSMLHSPFLAARLRVWSAAGRRRLHKLLAKMGISLAQCRQSYTHMDMQLKRGLRARLLRYAPMYGLDGLVPPDAAAAATILSATPNNDDDRRRKSGKGGGSSGGGGGGGGGGGAVAVASARHGGWGFVRNWGFKACLSASDVGVIVGALLEVGRTGRAGLGGGNVDGQRHGQRSARHKGPDSGGGGGGNESNAASGAGGGSGGAEEEDMDGADTNGDGGVVDVSGTAESEEWVARFWQAYDALEK